MINTDNSATLDALKENINKFLSNPRKEGPLYILDNSKPLGVFLEIDQYNHMKKLLEDALDVWEIRKMDKEDMVSLEEYHIKRTSK